MPATASKPAVAPPPWTVSGSAYLVAYRFSEEFAYQRARIPEALRGLFLGGLGALGLVEYETSPVGPYRELWFSPGQFAFEGRKYHSITHMYVTSPESVTHGQANWGLPKALAEIVLDRERGVDHWRVFQDGQVLLDVAFRPGRLSFPVWSWMVRPRLMQPWGERVYITRPRISGSARLADLTQPQGRSPDFPDLSDARPVGVVNLRHFRLTLPPARVVEQGNFIPSHDAS